MPAQLTQKERSLLEDQKSHEQVCIQKYQNYAMQAQDPKLRQMFNEYASHEQEHYNTLEQLLQGGGGQGGGGNQSASGKGQTGLTAMHAGQGAQQDAMLCNDMLMTEKYVSSTYDTAVFEMATSQVRQALQHIQREEQQHGEGIFNYMQQNGMYKTK